MIFEFSEKSSKVLGGVKMSPEQNIYGYERIKMLEKGNKGA